MIKALKKSLLFILLVIFCMPVLANEKVKIILEFEPSQEGGMRVYHVCARCHLPEAWGNKDGTYPQLAGQHINVLMKQLMDIRKGYRTSPLMYPFVQQRTVGGYQNLADVVSYISTLPMNPDHAKGPWKPGSSEHKEGKELYEAYCVGCHGAKGEGNNNLLYPKLQGQHFPYMTRQLGLVKDNIRTVDLAMTAVVGQLSKEQLEKIINYISYLPVDKDKIAQSTEWRNPDFK